MRSSLRFLCETFLPREARFPDERFWSRKTGEPIRPKRGEPPKGTVGTTASDWGVRDEPRSAKVYLSTGDFAETMNIGSWTKFEKMAEGFGLELEGSIGEYIIQGDPDKIKSLLDAFGIESEGPHIEWKGA